MRRPTALRSSRGLIFFLIVSPMAVYYSQCDFRREHSYSQSPLDFIAQAALCGQLARRVLVNHVGEPKLRSAVGSVYGLLPPDFVGSDGSEKPQNEGQKYLWECWQDMKR